MPGNKLPDFVFRGTTINYPGNNNAIQLPYTCTSFHPVKALWFALECLHLQPDGAVVYVARTRNLTDFKLIYNYFNRLENEVGFAMAPVDFYARCEGYIHAADLQRILATNGIEAYNVVRKDNLTRICRETPDLDAKKIVTLVEQMLPLLR